MSHVLHLRPRRPSIHHKQRRANRIKIEIIQDVASIMGDELDCFQLAHELDVPLAMVYHYGLTMLTCHSRDGLAKQLDRREAP